MRVLFFLRSFSFPLIFFRPVTSSFFIIFFVFFNFCSSYCSITKSGRTNSKVFDWEGYKTKTTENYVLLPQSKIFLFKNKIKGERIKRTEFRRNEDIEKKPKRENNKKRHKFSCFFFFDRSLGQQTDKKNPRATVSLLFLASLIWFFS